MITVAAYMVYVFEMLVIVIFVNMLMVAGLIVEDVKELQSVLRQRKHSTGEARLRLIKIVFMHQKYNE